jgi:mitochondrial fission protein ELM1
MSGSSIDAPAADADLRNLSVWIVTDGKAGDEQMAVGLAQALGVVPEIRRVAPRAPFSWLTPWGPVDPREAPQQAGSPIRPPFPDIAIASGRRSVPYLRALKRASGGRTFTVMLKDPYTGPATADLVWVPTHDRLRGPNVLTTVTPPHRISAERLAAARATPDPRLARLPHPRVAVLAGGDSRHHTYRRGDVERFIADITRVRESGASLMVTASRRTPPALRAALERLTADQGFLWDGAGENPYVAMLALADTIVVTADSYNMVGEAAATGAPILVFEPSGGHPKLDTFIESLKRHGAVKPFTGRLEAYAYVPLDATPTIAAAVAASLARHRRAQPWAHADGLGV